MAQKIKTLACSAHHLTLVPEIHMVEREQSVAYISHPLISTLVSVSTHKIKKFITLRDSQSKVVILFLGCRPEVVPTQEQALGCLCT